jgi:hypothetical protein
VGLALQAALKADQDVLQAEGERQGFYLQLVWGFGQEHDWHHMLRSFDVL